MDRATVVHVARNGFKDILLPLIERIMPVARNGFKDILLPLIERIMPMDSFEKTLNQCLQVASNNGYEQVVEYLIGEGAEVNAVVKKARGPSRRSRRTENLYDKKSTKKLSALQAALIGTADASSKQRIVELLQSKGVRKIPIEYRCGILHRRSSAGTYIIRCNGLDWLVGLD